MWSDHIRLVTVLTGSPCWITSVQNLHLNFRISWNECCHILRVAGALMDELMLLKVTSKPDTQFIHSLPEIPFLERVMLVFAKQERLLPLHQESDSKSKDCSGQLEAEQMRKVVSEAWRNTSSHFLVPQLLWLLHIADWHIACFGISCSYFSILLLLLPLFS